MHEVVDVHALGKHMSFQEDEVQDVDEEAEDVDNCSVSDDAESDENSDDEDIFNMKAATEDALSADYRVMWLYRWQLAVTRLSTHLRADVLLPLHPQESAAGEVWTDVKSGIILPPWHCAFVGCRATELTVEGCRYHEENVWQHVWKSGTHRSVLRDYIQEFRLCSSGQAEEEVAFTLYGLALAEKERACCP